MAGSTAALKRREPTPGEFVAMQQSPEFQELRSTFRGFTFPVMIAALLWYVFYVVIATFAPDAMAQDFLGLNVGLWLGLAQFFTTFLITWIYVKWANKNIEPRAAHIREEMEG
ncbi:DUF485 domain-containing protein [Corynebacterium ureicelerivorans]|uniref:Membrane protein n=1 Tax=Corynebacterium ureicelerivorans TaxID=401472 RepID=A0A077HJX6_9CORY|nr:DUF485 domain-containing protein [Corynebacterium ureicelerivorans]AIL96474.1 membrane protein [Corynebacterium ureicelerivorans]